jgi:hypothetical protein
MRRPAGLPVLEKNGAPAGKAGARDYRKDPSKREIYFFILVKEAVPSEPIAMAIFFALRPETTEGSTS